MVFNCRLMEHSRELNTLLIKLTVLKIDEVWNLIVVLIETSAESKSCN